MFEWHCDQIDEVFAVPDVEAFLARLRANLAWHVKRTGFIAHHLGLTSGRDVRAQNRGRDWLRMD